MVKKLLLVVAVSLSSSAMTLDEAISTALEKSPALNIAKNKTLQLEEAKKAKKSSNFGKVFLQGYYNKYDTPRTLAPITPPIKPGIPTTTEIKTLGIGYDVTLFDGFSTTNDIKIADLNKRAGELFYNLNKREVIYNIESMYLKILSLKNQKVSITSHVKALSSLKKTIQKAVDIGKKAMIDLYKVDADLTEAKIKEEELETNIKILKQNLAYLIGVKSVGRIYDLSDKSFKNDFKKVDIKTLSKYQIASLQRQKSKKQISKAKSLYYPKVTLTGVYNRNYGADTSEDIWQITLGAKWVLLDFGARGANLQRAKIDDLNAAWELRKKELEIYRDLQNAKMKVELSLNSLKSSQAQLRFVKKSLDVEKQRYKNSLSTINDLLFAYAKYEYTKALTISNKYDVLNAIYYYKNIAEEN